MTYYETTGSHTKVGLNADVPKTATEVGTAPTIGTGLVVAPQQFYFGASNLSVVTFGTGVTGDNVMGSTVADVRSATQGLLCVNVWSVGGSIDNVGFLPRSDEVRGEMTPDDTRFVKPFAVGRPGVGDTVAGTPA